MKCGSCSKIRAFGSDRIIEFRCGHMWCKVCLTAKSATKISAIMLGQCMDKECSHPGRFTMQRQGFLPDTPRLGSKGVFVHERELLTPMQIEELSVTMPELPDFLTAAPTPKSSTPLKSLLENIAPITMTELGIKYTTNLSETGLSKAKCRRCGRKKPDFLIQIMRLDCGHIFCDDCLPNANIPGEKLYCPFFRCQSLHTSVPIEKLKFAREGNGNYDIVFVKMDTECVQKAKTGMMPWDCDLSMLMLPEIPQPIPGIFPQAHTTAADLPDSW